MKKMILSLLVITLCVACNQIPNKSISKKIEIDELSKIIDKEPLFEKCYSEIQEDILPKLRTDVELAKYADITYRRYFKFYKFAEELENGSNATLEQAVATWEKTWGAQKYNIDSVVEFWRVPFEVEEYLNLPPSNSFPQSVKRYISFQKRNPEIENIYERDVIRECFDPNYIDLLTAKVNVIDSLLRLKDEKCFQLYEMAY